MSREIWRIAAPAIISNLTVPLLGLCDTTVSGHLGSAVPMAATAIGAMMFNVIFWLFGFLRMGTTGLTAQRYGAGQDTWSLLRRAAAIGIGAGTLLIIAQLPVSRLLLLIMSPEPEVKDLAASYFAICVWGAPAVLGTMALTGWFIGMQNTFYPMVISITVNTVNILLSIIFVFVCGFGIRGIALGTLGANWLGMIVAVFFLLTKFNRGDSAEHTDDPKVPWSRFFRVNIDIFFRSMCIMTITVALTAFGSRLGAEFVAVNTIILQFFHFFSYFMDGFAFAAEAMVGKYFGAGNRRMMWCTVHALLRWSAGCCLLFFTIYLLFSRGIVSLITNDLAVLELTMDFKAFIVLIPPLTVTAFIFDGFFIGVTATRRMLVTTVISTLIFFLVSYVHPWQTSAVGMPDNYTLWIAFLCYLTARGVILAIQTPKALNTNGLIRQCQT